MDRMELSEAIKLIKHKEYAPVKPVKWADLGCGSGLFTHALASLLPADSIIYAVDTNPNAVATITDYNNVTIKTIRQDFIRDEWPFHALDGILMANSFHYVKDKIAFLEKANQHLTDSGCFLLVEYDTDIPNPWVPYPVSYVSLQHLFNKAGYRVIERVQEMPSVYKSGNLYSSYISK